MSNNKNVPKRIYLNLGDDLPDDNYDFKDLSEVTWSEDKIYDCDLGYIHIDKVKQVMESLGGHGKLHCMANGQWSIRGSFRKETTDAILEEYLKDK